MPCSSPSQLSFFITGIANLLVEELSEDELEVLAAMFTALGDTITLLLSLKNCTENNI